MNVSRQHAVVFSGSCEIAPPSDEGQTNVLRGEGAVGESAFQGVETDGEVRVLAFEGRVKFVSGHRVIPCAGGRVILPWKGLSP